MSATASSNCLWEAPWALLPCGKEVGGTRSRRWVPDTPSTPQSQEVMGTKMLVCPELMCSYVCQLGKVSLPVFQCKNLRLREAKPPAEGHTAGRQSGRLGGQTPSLVLRWKRQALPRRSLLAGEAQGANPEVRLCRQHQVEPGSQVGQKAGRWPRRKTLVFSSGLCHHATPPRVSSLMLKLL